MTQPSSLAERKPEPQAICNPITRSAIFIVATLAPGAAAAQPCATGAPISPP